MKHRHYDMIIAWATDPTRPVEYYDSLSNEWYLAPMPKWDTSTLYRFKVELESHSNDSTLPMSRSVSEVKCMKRLYLADFAGSTEYEIKEHLANNYAGSVSGFDYGCPTQEEIDALSRLLLDYDILVAYESVGSWGCDSSSWFLLKNKITGQLFETSGSHCSCYGFEGQFDLQETSVEYLKSDKFYFGVGGYDDESEKNEGAVKQYLAEL